MAMFLRKKGGKTISSELREVIGLIYETLNQGLVKHYFVLLTPTNSSTNWLSYNLIKF